MPNLRSGERLMDDEVGLAMIRLWCEVLQDANPVYRDAEAARAAGFKGIIAPPPMILTWCFEAEWRPFGNEGGIASRFRDENPHYPLSVGLRSTQRHTRPLLLGERLRVRDRVDPPGPARSTLRGYGPTQRRSLSLHEADGTTVASIDFDTVRLAERLHESGLENRLDAMTRIEPDRVAATSAEADVGAVLPVVSLPVTLKRCIRWVAATRDFYEVHHDRDYARSTGARDLYIGVHFFQGLVHRMITDWTGPSGFVRSLTVDQYGRCYPGETAVAQGRVVAVRDDRNCRIFEINAEAGCERGRLYGARAEVEVPK